MSEERDPNERPDNESERRSLLDRAGDAVDRASDAVDRASDMVGSAQRTVSRTVDLVTGADIRKFDEFTDATTRAVVGVHQDLTELTTRVEKLERASSRKGLALWIIGIGAIGVALPLGLVAVILSVS